MNGLKALRLLLALTCEESTRLISDQCERPLSPVERWAVRLHFISCMPCRRFRKQLAFLHQLLQTRYQHDPRLRAARLSPQTRDRIARQIVLNSPGD